MVRLQRAEPERLHLEAVVQTLPEDLPGAEQAFGASPLIASICHDLRIPLSAILANAEFLSEPGMSKMERIEIYREIETSVVQMNELISSLLESSGGADSFRPSVCNIVETVERAIKVSSVKPEFRRIAIQRHHRGRALGWFDSSLLERAFANLVQNACEAVCPEEGEIMITTSGDPFHLQIDISDNGPGIPHEIHESVFRPFVSHGKAKGNGLGLAIAKNMVERHGGEIRIDSSGGTGTLFRITIPDAIFEGHDSVVTN